MSFNLTRYDRFVQQCILCNERSVASFISASSGVACGLSAAMSASMATAKRVSPTALALRPGTRVHAAESSAIRGSFRACPNYSRDSHKKFTAPVLPAHPPCLLELRECARLALKYGKRSGVERIARLEALSKIFLRSAVAGHRIDRHPIGRILSPRSKYQSAIPFLS